MFLKVFGPILFNIHLNDQLIFIILFVIWTYSVSWKNLKESSDLAIVWFENNYGKLNTNNYQALVFGHLRRWLEVWRFRKTKKF